MLAAQITDPASIVLYGPHMEVPIEIYERYFSAWSAHAIEVSSETLPLIEMPTSVFPTVEHAYHYLRYSHLPEICEHIRAARSPFKAWEISQQHKARQLEVFPRLRMSAMYALCKAKLQQHDDVHQALLETGGFFIVKRVFTGPPGDGYWDEGPDGTGKNTAGKIWDRLRDSLRKP